jgi:hypothetical protein
MGKEYAYTHNYERNIVNRSNDRILELVIRDKDKPKNSIGLVDNRLFSGGNRLHAVQDAGLWYLKYDKGKIPAVLEQKFTTFSALLRCTKNYFDQRNIDIKEVVDSAPGT